MDELILTIVENFKELSYIGIMLALTIEFVPAEIVLPLAGYWVYQGDMTLFGTVLAGTIGGTFGPLTLYALGRFGGRPFILKYGKYFFINEEKLSKADEFFEKTEEWLHLQQGFYRVFAHLFLFHVEWQK